MKHLIKDFSLFTYLLLALILYIYIYIYIYIANTLPLFQWDESRLGVNAVEMLRSKNFIVTTFLGEADNWNTKPPFAIWTICSSIYLFGLTELTLRIPSILFSILTIVLVLYIIKKEIKILNNLNYLFIIILSSCIGFSGYHLAITADYDGILIFFFTVLNISLYFCLKSIHIDLNKTRKYFLFAITAFTLGFLTKGIAIGFAVPGILLYFAMRKKNFVLFKYKYFYIGIFSSALIILGYYFLRNSLSSEYIQSVINNEFSRFNQTTESHSESKWFYITNLFEGRFSLWLYFILFTPILLFSKKNAELKSISLFNSTIIVSYYILLSISNTKLAWYDASIYPIISLQILINIYFLLSEITSNTIKYSFYILIFLLSIGTYYNLYLYYEHLIYDNEWPNQKESLLLKNFEKNHEIKEVNYIKWGHFSHLDLYKYIYESKRIPFNLWRYEDLFVDSTKLFFTSEYNTIRNVNAYYTSRRYEESKNGIVFNLLKIDQDKLNREINFKWETIKKNKGWEKEIVKKAKTRNLSLKKQLILDIIYLDSLNFKCYNREIRQYLRDNYLKFKIS